MRALLLPLLLVCALAALPAADACCHVRHLRADAGPCFVEWEGVGEKLLTHHVRVSCAGTPVDETIVPPPLLP